MSLNSKNLRVPSEGEPQLTDDEGAIHLSHRVDPRRGLAKVAIQTDGPDEGDSLKAALDYDRTQREWDARNNQWTANLRSLNRITEALSDTEHTVTVDMDVARTFSDYERGGKFLPQRE